jgi:hypothetical protein
LQIQKVVHQLIDYCLVIYTTQFERMGFIIINKQGSKGLEFKVIQKNYYISKQAFG